ncbi:MAG: VOC family protein [Haliangiales bacterium]
MTTVTGYQHGQFAWIDLVASDIDAVRGFYQALFGWQSSPLDNPDGPAYALFTVEGQPVAGIGGVADRDDSQTAAGSSPLWKTYICVDDMDETIAKAAAMGATLTAPPAALGRAGQRATLRDPTGAPIGLWRPGTLAGVARAYQPGALGWNELATRDSDAARGFYGGLFGWDLQKNPDAPAIYHIIRYQDERRGGIMQMTAEWGEMASHWMVYFVTAAIDDATATVSAQGGEVCVPSFDTPAGRIAVVNDPQGATFSLIQPRAAD